MSNCIQDNECLSVHVDMIRITLGAEVHECARQLTKNKEGLVYVGN